MKKLFISALALAAFTACSQEEIVEQQASTAIAFEQAFVDNATRAAEDPSTTTNSITGFNVWGFIEQVDGTLFEGEEVTKQGNNWSYKNLQYWSPNHDYYFTALSPLKSENTHWEVSTAGMNQNGIGVVSFTNVDGTEDLLYAETKVSSGTGPDYGKVGLTFDHLLSKVKFTFTNGFPNANTQLVVKDINMVVPNKGSIDLASDANWVIAGDATDLTLSFGDVARLISGETDECAFERLTIPAEAAQEYTVTFTVDLYQGNFLAQSFNETTKVTGVALEKGNAYNFKAELNASVLGLKPIEFEVIKVNDWVEAEKDGNLIVTLGGELDGNYTMISNAVAESTVVVSGVFDGAGNTITPSKETKDLATFLTASTLRFITANGDATIKNMTINGADASYSDGTKTYGIRGIFIAGNGKCIIDNVEVLNSTYGINTGSGSHELYVSNSTLEGWSSWDGTTCAEFTNVTFNYNDAANLGNVRPYHSTTFTNCTFGNQVTLDTSCVEDGEVITLIDCYVDDTKITAANVVTLFPGINASKLAFNSSVADVTGEDGATMEMDGVAVTSVKVTNSTLDGAGYELTVAGTPGDNGIIRPEGTSTIKNLTVDGQNKTFDGDKGMRAIYITKGGTYTIENVNIKNVTYPINVNTKAEVILNVYNSTLEGWTSYGTSTTGYFEKVAFTKNTVNNLGNFRPYGATYLKDCTFTDVKVDLSYFAGEYLKIETCYYNGNLMTAANISDWATSYEGKNITYVK